MCFLKIALLSTIAVLVAQTTCYAHGDAPHPTCKKGYVLSANHKCVKA